MTACSIRCFTDNEVEQINNKESGFKNVIAIRLQDYNTVDGYKVLTSETNFDEGIEVFQKLMIAYKE